MKSNEVLTEAIKNKLYKYCHEYFEYREGKLFWKKVRSNSTVMGEEIGCISSKGYWRIGLNNRVLYRHRVIFFMHHGYMPKYIDHIDGDKSNDRIENLRDCTNSDNLKNRGRPSNNTSGYKGVSYKKHIDKWVVMITNHEGKYKYLGVYKCRHEAARVWNTAARMYHGRYAYTNKIGAVNEVLRCN